jgi:hypothetical protein
MKLRDSKKENSKNKPTELTECESAKATLASLNDMNLKDKELDELTALLTEENVGVIMDAS